MNGILGNKAVFGVLLALFLAASVGGVFTAGMMDDGAAYNCPYMGVPVLCAMNPLGHLSQWQLTFATMVQQTSTLALLLFALCAAFLSSVHLRLLRPRLSGVYQYRSPPLVPQKEKITRWLSLFEHSPSQI